jgi:hypothetical protein
LAFLFPFSPQGRPCLTPEQRPRHIQLCTSIATLLQHQGTPERLPSPARTNRREDAPPVVLRVNAVRRRAAHRHSPCSRDATLPADFAVACWTGCGRVRPLFACAQPSADQGVFQRAVRADWPGRRRLYCARCAGVAGAGKPCTRRRPSARPARPSGSRTGSARSGGGPQPIPQTRSALRTADADTSEARRVVGRKARSVEDWNPPTGLSTVIHGSTTTRPSDVDDASKNNVITFVARTYISYKIQMRAFT